MNVPRVVAEAKDAYDERKPGQDAYSWREEQGQLRLLDEVPA